MFGFVVVVIGKYTPWSYRYYGWVCRCCRQSVNIISGGIMFGFVVVVIGKYTQRMVIRYYGWVCRCCRQSVNIISGGIMFGFVVVVIGKYTQRMVIPVLWLGLSLLSSVSTHNAWSYRYYGWVCRCCRQSVNIISGGIMFGFVVVVIGKYTQRMVIPVL